MLSVLEDIQNMCYSLNSRDKVLVPTDGKSYRYCCSETVFSLSKHIPTDTKIKVFEKSRFRQKLMSLNSEVTVRNFVDGEEVNDHLAIEVILRKVEKELFKITDKEVWHSNFTLEERKAIQSSESYSQVVLRKQVNVLVGHLGIEMIIFLRLKDN